MKEKGFTLVEFMIALFIFAVISAGIYTVFIQANKAFQSGRKQVLESQNARVAIEVLAREIRQTTFFLAGFDSLTVRDTGGNRITYYLEGPVENQELHRVVRDAFDVFVSDNIKARYIKSLAFDYFGNDFSLDTDGNGLVTASEIMVLGGSLTAIDTDSEKAKVTLIKITVEVDTDRFDFNSDGVIDRDGSKNTIVETSVQLRNLKLF